MPLPEPKAPGFIADRDAWLEIIEGPYNELARLTREHAKQKVRESDRQIERGPPWTSSTRPSATRP